MDGTLLERAVGISALTFLTSAEKNILLQKLDSLSSLALVSMEDICCMTRRRIRARFDGRQAVLRARRALAVIEALHIHVLTESDPAFPALLREIADAPFVLFCRGNASCLCTRSVSVVGTRRITAPGRAAATAFAADAARAGYTVVSGLAHGVDEAAHAGALNAYFDALEKDESCAAAVGKTCAVLPGGIDDIVPAGNRRLAEKIVSGGGCLISEFPPGVPVERWRFVQRNRIVAGLSPATVVIEAPPGSGALLTADFAAGYGREVMIHDAACSESAQMMAAYVVQENAQAGKRARERTIMHYIEDGAPRITDFKDYVRTFTGCPGARHVVREEDAQPAIGERNK
ncbi:MAG: DNA-processing protein DprA [Treponema sp.]|nr:DNA-processing protein DprA [Treponema sp.]